jgi:hypothetical protein
LQIGDWENVVLDSGAWSPHQHRSLAYEVENKNKYTMNLTESRQVITFMRWSRTKDL